MVRKCAFCSEDALLWDKRLDRYVCEEHYGMTREEIRGLATKVNEDG